MQPYRYALVLEFDTPQHITQLELVKIQEEAVLADFPMVQKRDGKLVNAEIHYAGRGPDNGE